MRAPAGRGGLGRRAALRLGAAAAGSLAGAGLLGAGATTAAPIRAAANPVVISAHLHMASLTWPPNPALAELIDQALQPLYAANPGLVVRFFPQSDNWQGWQASTQGSMLAGNGPDVFADWILTGYASADLALDLMPFVRRDNLNLGVYQQGQIRYIREAGLLSPSTAIQLMALPQYPYPEAMAVNLGMLDDMGVRYPEPGWNYTQWTRLWQSATVRAQGSRPGHFGVDFSSDADFWDGYNFSYNLPGAWVLHGFGGEFVNPQNQARSYLDSPGSIAAAQWAYDLIFSGVAANKTFPDFATGQVATTMWPAASLPQSAEQWRGLKWDFFTLPVWPVQANTYTSTDSLGIWSGTKNPEAAWAVLQWVAYSKTWQRMQIRATLQAPSRRDMTEEWIAIVRQVAPPLRDKNLEVWVAQERADLEYMGMLFRYSEASVQAILAALAANVMSKKVTVAEGFAQAARQIDALEVSGRAVSAAAGRSLALYDRDIARALASGGTGTFPAPSRTGVGTAPVDDPRQVVERAGAWTVVGGGSGVNGNTDGLTFACAPFTGAKGVFTCRISAVKALKPTTLAAGAKFGLMVRGDLSDDAASLGVEVSAGRGIHSHVQTRPGAAMGDQRPGSSWNDAGLLPASEVLLPNTRAAKNFLVRPVWLRIVRDINLWTAYTSLDGTHWTQAGPAFAAQVLGCWVGVYATAHQNGALASATFDHLQGFAPDTFVRIGAP